MLLSSYHTRYIALNEELIIDMLENAAYRKLGEECGSCHTQYPMACGYAGFCEEDLLCINDLGSSMSGPSVISDGPGKCVSMYSKLRSRTLMSYKS